MNKNIVAWLLPALGALAARLDAAWPTTPDEWLKAVVVSALLGLVGPTAKVVNREIDNRNKAGGDQP